MERIRTTEIRAYLGRTVLVAGWLHAVRKMGGISFIVVRDGWGMVQAVAEDETALAPLAEAGAGVESIITVEGEVVAAPQAPGGHELHHPRIAVINPVTEPLPVTINKRAIKASLTTMLDHAVITNRHPARRAVLRLAAGVMAAFRSTLTARGFTEIQTPKIVAAATESGANVFQLDYFGRPAFLAQSPQFYKQIMVGVFERVFEVGPVFRAEPHDTIRHVNAYVSLDVEMGFIEDHFTVMALARDVIAAILDGLRTG
ncbi:MAG: aspartate--tRNA(Asn) ligase, partial [Firmicutes bacterium]|nr:aspartate--tRNA(Asn) ligase [Bacillota bacterium]